MRVCVGGGVVLDGGGGGGGDVTGQVNNEKQ